MAVEGASRIDIEITFPLESISAIAAAADLDAKTVLIFTVSLGTLGGVWPLRRSAPKRTTPVHRRRNATLVTANIAEDPGSLPSAERNGAPGIDGVTWYAYQEENLEEKLKDLHGRIHRGSYRARACGWQSRHVNVALRYAPAALAKRFVELRFSVRAGALR